MNKMKLAVFTFIVMIICSGCSLKKGGEDIIKIDGTPITKVEFDKAYNEAISNNMFAQMGIDIKKDPNNTFALMIKEKVVAELIVKTILENEMEKNKITVSKDDIQNAEKEVINKFGTKEQFLQILKLNGVDYDKFKKDLEDEIKLKKYVDSIAMVSVGESEAKKYYNENIDKFKYPQRVRASHILISSNKEQIKAQIKKATPDISEKELNNKVQQIMNNNRKKAESILARVKKSPDNFAKIAKETSQDTGSAIKGGDLGYFGKDEMVEEFANKAFDMAPNTISGIVQTQFGYHIIKVTDRTEAGTYSFEQSKKDIINLLESQDKVEILKNKIETLRKSAKIEFLSDDYNPEILQKKIKSATAADKKQNAEITNEINLEKPKKK